MGKHRIPCSFGCEQCAEENKTALIEERGVNGFADGYKSNPDIIDPKDALIAHQARALRMLAERIVARVTAKTSKQYEARVKATIEQALDATKDAKEAGDAT